MTDEEMAEKEYENCNFEKIEHYCDKAIFVTGFLAGLKAGKSQKHKTYKMRLTPVISGKMCFNRQIVIPILSLEEGSDFAIWLCSLMATVSGKEYYDDKNRIIKTIDDTDKE